MSNNDNNVQFNFNFNFKNITDGIEIKEFLDKRRILDYINEEDIFEIVFGFKPVEFEYVTSPFREDKHPGCWFEYTISGRLKFIDWASEYYVNGIQMVNIDCFDAVKIYFNLPNFYETVKLVYNHLIKGKDLPVINKKVKQKKKPKGNTIINIETRAFDKRDQLFWEKYGISSKNLKDDKVFAINRYQIIYPTGKKRTIRTFGISYAYTDFEDGKKKIYSSYANKRGKFITNCGKDDIGGLHSLDSGNKLIITKSYKDYRVLKNQHYHVVWFQNEGMFPTPFTLLPILQRFKEIIILFDNDRAGRDTSNRLVTYIQNMDRRLKVKNICVPEYPKVKDPSDLAHRKGLKVLNDFLKKNI